jgi:hypothetical protein
VHHVLPLASAAAPAAAARHAWHRVQGGGTQRLSCGEAGWG